MSDFFGKLKSGAGKVAFEAEKMNRLNKAKGELEQLKRQIQTQFTKLGEMYYQQRTTMGVSGPTYDEICQAIEDLEGQVGHKNEDIQRINAETYAPQGVQAAPQVMQAAPQPTPPPATPTPAPEKTTKFCPNCGKEMAITVKFCPDCGTRM